MVTVKRVSYGWFLIVFTPVTWPALTGDTWPVNDGTRPGSIPGPYPYSPGGFPLVEVVAPAEPVAGPDIYHLIDLSLGGVLTVGPLVVNARTLDATGAPTFAIYTRGRGGAGKVTTRGDPAVIDAL